MMIIFRLYLSATTPAHSEINICGVSAAIVDIVIQLPEEVLSVIYQMMLKPTTEEPNMERFWLMRKRNISFFHLLLLAVISLFFKSISLAPRNPYASGNDAGRLAGKRSAFSVMRRPSRIRHISQDLSVFDGLRL